MPTYHDRTGNLLELAFTGRLPLLDRTSSRSTSASRRRVAPSVAPHVAPGWAPTLAGLLVVLGSRRATTAVAAHAAFQLYAVIGSAALGSMLFDRTSATYLRGAP